MQLETQFPNCKYLSEDKHDLQLVVFSSGPLSHSLQSGWQS